MGVFHQPPDLDDFEAFFLDFEAEEPGEEIVEHFLADGTCVIFADHRKGRLAGAEPLQVSASADIFRCPRGFLFDFFDGDLDFQFVLATFN